MTKKDVVALVAVIVLALLVLQWLPDWINANLVATGMIGLACAAIILWWMGKPSFPSTGSVAMQIAISSVVVATFFYLLSKIYPDAPLFQPGEGYGHIALYFLLVGLIALVAANFKGKAWFVNTALLVLMFAMLGHRTADLLDPSGKLSATIASYIPFSGHGGGSGKRVATGTPVNECVSEQVTLRAGEVEDINPHNCDLKLAYPNRCLTLKRGEWTQDTTWYRNVCDIPGIDTAAPNNIRYAYSTSPVVMFVQRRPH